MEDIYLCSDYLKAHPLYKIYGSNLFDQSEKDYPGKGFFSGYQIPSIDLDAFERDTKISNDCTSDGVIGVADCGVSQLKNRRLLLTELRLGYDNQKNLHFSNLQQKYRHSCEILYRFDSNVRIDPKFALIFTKSLTPKAKRWIRDWAHESTKKEAENWKVYYPESYCNYINYGKTLPLTPSEETIATIGSICSNSIIGYDNLCYFKEKMENYWWLLKGKNLMVDMEYFARNISLFISSATFPAGEEGEYCKLLKAEIEEIISI